MSDREFDTIATHRRPAWRLPIVATGVATVLFALFGLIHNAVVLWASSVGPDLARQQIPFDWVRIFVFLTAPGLIREQREPHYYVVFYAMSAICAVCNALLLAAGLQLVRMRLSWAPVLIGVWLFEMLYLGAVWCIPALRATGGIGANLSITWQFAILLPFWGSLLLVLARRHDGRVAEARSMRSWVILRDTAIILALFLGGQIAGGTAAGWAEVVFGIQLPVLVVGAFSGCFTSAIGFAVMGSRVGGARWRHLSVVAVLAWLTYNVSFARDALLGVLSLLFAAYAMGLGGAASYLLGRKRPSSEVLAR